MFFLPVLYFLVFKLDVLRLFEDNRFYKNGQNFFLKKKKLKKAKNVIFPEKKAKIQKKQNPLSKIGRATFFRNLIKFSKKNFFFIFNQKWHFSEFFKTERQNRPKIGQKWPIAQKQAKIQKKQNPLSKICRATFF